MKKWSVIDWKSRITRRETFTWCCPIKSSF